MHSLSPEEAGLGVDVSLSSAVWPQQWSVRLDLVPTLKNHRPGYCRIREQPRGFCLFVLNSSD